MPRGETIKDTVIAVTVPLVLVILLALLGFAWRLHARAPSAIEQPSAIARCLPPSEYELLHVIVSRKGDRIEASCAYLGPRGAYK